MISNLPRIDTDVDLSTFNSFGISVNAAEFVRIEENKQLQALFEVGFFDEKNPFILGGGSNVLILESPKRPFIMISIKGKKIILRENDSVKVEVGAGENWHEFVTWAVNNDFGGIENLALIPGTVGAAPVQNIGAYGVEFDEIFDSVHFFDTQKGIFQTFNKMDCRFGYRDSIFKHELKGKAIITSVTLNLSTQNHKISDNYRSLQRYLSEKNGKEPGIRDLYGAVIDIRQSKLPDPNKIGNAGSFFKNPIISKDKFERMKNKYEKIPSYKLGENEVKVPAAWLVESAGWKGKRIGSVGTYKKQPLVIVNHGNATGSEILDFSRKIQQSVEDLFGIILVPEVNIVE